MSAVTKSWCVVAGAALLLACDGGPTDPRPGAVANCGQEPGLLHTGNIATETWRAQHSPHVIRDSVLIDGTLTIEPGAKICGEADALILVRSNALLNVIGTANAPIIFTAADTTQPWGGIERRYLECSGSGCPPLPEAQIRHARFEYARNAVVSFPVDSSHFRQIRCTAVHSHRLTFSVVDTAGIDGCSAVIMGSGHGDEQTFIGNIIRGSGGRGLSFHTSGLRTSDHASDQITLRDSRIENSAGTGLYFEYRYTGSQIVDGSPIRIVGSGGNPVEGPIGAVLRLWPTRAAQDSLLGNARDTVVVWGDADQGEIVARPDLHWRFRNHSLVPWFVMGSQVNIHVEPGGSVTAADIRMQGALTAQGTAARPAMLSGVFNHSCPPSSGLCGATNLSYATLTGGIFIASPQSVLDHLTIDGTYVGLRDGAVLRHSIVQNSQALELADNTRVEHTIIRNGNSSGVWILGAHVTLENCEVSGSAGDGIFVVAPAAPAAHTVQVRNCVLENNTGAGISNIGAGAQQLDARFNWWGDPSGPFGAAGDSVSANVDYSSHLTTRPVVSVD